MSAASVLWWPDDLLAREAEHIVDAEEGDNRADIEHALRRAEDRAAALSKAVEAAELTGDDAAYDRAQEAFSEAYSLVVALERRLLDLEDRNARAEKRGRIGWLRWASF